MPVRLIIRQTHRYPQPNLVRSDVCWQGLPMDDLVSARRQRQREAIMAATLRLASEVGWQQVTMRKLAASLEIQPASLYEYFPSKEGIFAALIEDGYTRLLFNLTSGNDEPDLQILVKRIWTFAWKEPQVYQAIHGLAGVPYGWESRRPEAKALFALLRAAIARETGGRPGLVFDLDAATDICWALIHGTVALAMAHRLAGGRTRAARLLESGIEALVSSWQQRPGVPPRVARM